jgi:antitoxin VapB
MKEAIPLRERLEAFWRDNPLPPATGHKADKAFFDELSGDL